MFRSALLTQELRPKIVCGGSLLRPPSTPIRQEKEKLPHLPPAQTATGEGWVAILDG